MIPKLDVVNVSAHKSDGGRKVHRGPHHSQLLVACQTLLVILLAATSAEAVTKYVNASCSNGVTTYNPATNSCTGGSATVYSTVTNGLNALATGDVLDIRTGTYNENITIGASKATGTAGSPITVQGHPGETVTINGSHTFTDGANRQYWVFDNLIFRGGHEGWYFGSSNDHITIQNSDIGFARCMGIEGGASFLTIKNTPIHDNGATCPVSSHLALVGYGIYWWGSDSLFEYVDVYNNHGNGLHNYADPPMAPSRNVYRYSKFHNNCTDGAGGQSPEGGEAALVSSGDDNEFYGNLVYDNIWCLRGIQTGGTRGFNTKIYNNTVYNNTTAGGGATNYYGIVANLNASVRNNIVYNNGIAGILISGTTTATHNHCNTTSNCGSNATGGNPLFVNAGAGDFHLQAGSPALTSGAILASNPPLHTYNIDLDGNTRTTWTRGAYEFDGAPPVVRQLTFESSNPASGCLVTATPLDNSSVGSGTTPDHFLYNDGTIVSLTAAATCGGNDFTKWQKGGVDVSLSANVLVTMDAAYTMTAFYTSPAPTTFDLTIASASPASGARISVSPNDNAGLNSGSTSFVRNFNTGATATIIARTTSNAPLLWLKLDEGSGTAANDSSNDGLHGTLINGPTWVAGDGSPFAVNFDGLNGYIQVADSNLFTNLVEWKISARANPSVPLSTFKALIVKNYNFGLYGSSQGYSYGAGAPLGFFVHTSGETYVVGETGPPNPLPVGAFTKLGVACSGTTLSILRNNTVTGTTTVPSCAIQNSTAVLQIAASQYGENFPGVIDDVRICGVICDESDPGNAFVSWAGCTSVVGPVCTRVMSSALTVTATFASSSVQLAQSAFKIYDLAMNSGVLVDITAIAKVQKGGSFIVASQIDATVANPPFTTIKQYYNKDGGAYAAVPDSFGADNIRWHGTADTRFNVPVEGHPITGNLSGALANFPGTTSRTAAGTPSFDIDQDASIVNASLIQFDSDAAGLYCFRWYRNDDTPLDSYGATGCVTVTAISSSGV